MRIEKIILDKISIFRYNTLMKKYKRKPWSEAERRVLTTNYQTMDIKELTFLLPDRTVQAIRNQAAYLRKKGIRFIT